MGRRRRWASATALMASAIVGLGAVLGAVPGLSVPQASAKTVLLRQPPDPFLGRLKPTAAAASEGMFGPQISWPLIPLQVVLMPNGSLVSYGSALGVAVQEGLHYDVWKPWLGAGTGSHRQTTSMHAYNSFCSGMTRLKDGRVFMVGGNSTMSSMAFDPVSRVQVAGSPLHQQRWYATTLRRPDNSVLVLGGADYYNTHAYEDPNNNTGVAITPEIGPGVGAPWKALTGATSAMAFGARDNRWWYPRAYNGPGNRVVGVSADQLWTMSTSGAGSIRKLATLPSSIGISGSSVMYKPGVLLLAGGGQQLEGDWTPASSAATLVDLRGDQVKIRPTSPMRSGRNWLNLTVLPTGRVLANGGTKVGIRPGAANSVYTSEVWNPATGSWSKAATAKRIRTYHSTSLLMPSGAVFTGGGGVPGPEDNMNAELYYPSYLFKKGSDGIVRWASRPKITKLSGSIRYGRSITLGMSSKRAIASASLISLGTVTHSFNVDQRRIPLKVRQSGSRVSVTLPRSVNTMPPGSYQLTVVDKKGVPSPAQIITVKRGEAGAVTRFAATQAVGGGVTSAGSVAGVTEATPGTQIGLEPFDQQGARLVVSGTDIVAREVDGNESDKQRARSSFTVRRGLSGGTAVSLQTADGRYLRVRDGTVVAESPPPDIGVASAFAREASFDAVPGRTGHLTSFRVVADPALYLHQKGLALTAGPVTATDQDRHASTFGVRRALTPGLLAQLRSAGKLATPRLAPASAGCTGSGATTCCGSSGCCHDEHCGTR